MAPPQNTKRESATVANLKSVLKQLAEKIGELEGERDEHLQVIETLKGVDKDVRAWRLVDRVLVEGTAGVTLEVILKWSMKVLHSSARHNIVN